MSHRNIIRERFQKRKEKIKTKLFGADPKKLKKITAYSLKIFSPIQILFGTCPYWMLLLLRFLLKLFSHHIHIFSNLFSWDWFCQFDLVLNYLNFNKLNTRKGLKQTNLIKLVKSSDPAITQSKLSNCSKNNKTFFAWFGSSSILHSLTPSPIVGQKKPPYVISRRPILKREEQHNPRNGPKTF